MSLFASLESKVIGALLIAVALSGVYGYAQHAEVKSLKAETKPLRDAARDAGRIGDALRRQLATCEGEKLANGHANDRAIAQAQKDAAEAAARAESYYQRLQHAGAECDTRLSEPLCPALRDY